MYIYYKISTLLSIKSKCVLLEDNCKIASNDAQKYVYISTKNDNKINFRYLKAISFEKCIKGFPDNVSLI